MCAVLEKMGTNENRNVPSVCKKEFSLAETLVWDVLSHSHCVNVTLVTENEQHSLGTLRNPNYP